MCMDVDISSAETRDRHRRAKEIHIAVVTGNGQRELIEERRKHLLPVYGPYHPPEIGLVQGWPL